MINPFTHDPYLTRINDLFKKYGNASHTLRPILVTYGEQVWYITENGLS